MVNLQRTVDGLRNDAQVAAAQLTALEQEKEALLLQIEGSNDALKQSNQIQDGLRQDLARQLRVFEEAQEKSVEAERTLRDSLDSALASIKSKEEEFSRFKNAKESAFEELKTENEKQKKKADDLQVNIYF